MSLAGNSGINCRQREGISTSYTNLRTLRRAIAGLAVSVPAWPVRRKRRLHRPPKQPFDSAGPSIERGPSMSMGRIVAGDRRRHRHARQCGTAASNARVCSRWDADGCQPSTIFQKTPSRSRREWLDWLDSAPDGAAVSLELGLCIAKRLCTATVDWT